MFSHVSVHDQPLVVTPMVVFAIVPLIVVPHLAQTQDPLSLATHNAAMEPCMKIHPLLTYSQSIKNRFLGLPHVPIVQPTAVIPKHVVSFVTLVPAPWVFMLEIARPHVVPEIVDGMAFPPPAYLEDLSLATLIDLISHQDHALLPLIAPMLQAIQPLAICMVQLDGVDISLMLSQFRSSRDQPLVLPFLVLLHLSKVVLVG